MQLANMFRFANANGQQQKKSSDPSGIIPVPLDQNSRVEVRYWENPIKDSPTIRIGYNKPRIVTQRNGDKSYHSFQLRQALVDVLATYLLCKNVIERHGKEIFVDEQDLQAATQVVAAFEVAFLAQTNAPNSAAPAVQNLAHSTVPNQFQPVELNGNDVLENSTVPNLLKRS